ncbi:hypothetical protein [Actinocorallia longicatena]|uniref:Uncharacterized protein n=1 Tax=Actinocorallia longicatena TaxID=111803 RepID=A0ABP6QHR0_9ACTN
MAHAEIEEVWPREGRVRLDGSLIDAAPGGRLLELRCTAPPSRSLLHRAAARVLRGPRLRRFPAVVEGTLFSTTFPVSAFARPRPWPEWEMYLVPLAAGSPAAELRLGRHLDDVPKKAEVYVYPAQKARGVRVKPVFTDGDHLALRCRRAR